MEEQRVLTGEEVQALLTGFIQTTMQVGPASVTLTVKAVEEVIGSGALDFDGSEHKPVETNPFHPERRVPEEPYGWWFLKRGRFRVTYNEEGTIPDGHGGLLLPSAGAVDGGLIHPTVFLPPGASLPTLVVAAGAHGVRIKEGARISELVLFRLK